MTCYCRVKVLLSLIFTITKFVTCYCRVKVLLSLIFTITYDLLLQSESVAKFDLYYHL